jgi:hypothetical protein
LEKRISPAKEFVVRIYPWYLKMQTSCLTLPYSCLVATFFKEQSLQETMQKYNLRKQELATISPAALVGLTACFYYKQD